MKKILLFLFSLAVCGWGLDTLEIGVFGQSNICARSTGNAPVIADVKAQMLYNDAIVHLRDDWQGDSSASLTSILPPTANQFITMTHDTVVPIFSGYAVGGKGIHDTWHAKGAYYDTLIKRLKVRHPRTIIMYAGETDAVNGVDSTTITNDIIDLQVWMTDSLGYKPKYLMVQINRWVEDGPYGICTGTFKIWRGISNAVDDSTRFMVCAYDLPVLNNTSNNHLAFAAQCSLGVRLGNDLAKIYYGTMTNGYDGPRFDSAYAKGRGNIRVWPRYGTGTTITAPSSSVINLYCRWTSGVPVNSISAVSGGAYFDFGVADRAMVNPIEIRYVDPQTVECDTSGCDDTQFILDNNNLPLEPF